MGTAVAYAKINLYLDVISRGNDGFHEIESIMQTVSLSDSVFVSADIQDKTEILIECNLPYVPCNEKNLAWRAAKALLDKTEINAKVAITLDKHIPVSAGMAGGSSDAAAVLRELNLLLGSPLNREELLSLGTTIGSDIPFCITGGTYICRGKGEMLERCPSMPHCYIVCAMGGRGVSTPAAYAKLDELYGNFSSSNPHANISKLVNSLSLGSFDGMCDSVYNIFEEAVLPQHKIASEIKRILASCGGDSMMSGSGPSVFAMFQDKKTAEHASKIISEKGYFSAVCEPVGEYN